MGPDGSVDQNLCFSAIFTHLSPSFTYFCVRKCTSIRYVGLLGVEVQSNMSESGTYGGTNSALLLKVSIKLLHVRHLVSDNFVIHDFATVVTGEISQFFDCFVHKRTVKPLYNGHHWE